MLFLLWSKWRNQAHVGKARLMTALRGPFLRDLGNAAERELVESAAHQDLPSFLAQCRFPPEGGNLGAQSPETRGRQVLEKLQRANASSIHLGPGELADTRGGGQTLETMGKQGEIVLPPSYIGRASFSDTTG